MAEYHVGCGMFGIYAGTLEPKNKNLWRNKTDVTQEALSAAAEYLYRNNKEVRFSFDGKDYVMRIAERREE